LRDNDTAFFQHAARITEKLAKKSNLRLFVLIVGKVDKQTPLAVITEKVNQWLVSVGEKPVAIDRVAYEMKAMKRKYKAGKNKK
jgi:L-fucose isomerase-like protein